MWETYFRLDNIYGSTVDGYLQVRLDEWLREVVGECEIRFYTSSSAIILRRDLCSDHSEIIEIRTSLF